MAGHAFRLLLVGGPDTLPIAQIRRELRQARPDLVGRGIPLFEVHQLPRFEFLDGERNVPRRRLRLPKVPRVSERLRQAIPGNIAVAKLVLLPGPTFLPALDVVRERIAQWNYQQQSDPAIGPALWAPSAAFGNLDEAKRLIGMTAQHGALPVNVVIVDQGFDKALVAPPFGGGWYQAGTTPLPGQGKSRHALTTARAVRALAPNATLYDAPLIPTPPKGAPATINDVEAFADDAIGLWLAIWTTLLTANDSGASWIFVNAWALSDLSSERLAPRPHYSTDRAHLLNMLHDAVIATRNIDVVYAAGNCGQYQPDSRCGRNDRGPCRSIWGANSLDTVLTVGAVRTDRTWLGYSSQGPGQPDLDSGSNKPDLVAPTQFADDHDAAWIYGGTSAACAVAAGVVAALRSKRPQRGPGALSPAGLKTALQAACLKPELNQSGFELGAGVIRFGETYDAI